MSSAVGEILSEISLNVIPQVAAVAFPDTMDILAKSVSTGTDGGQIKTGNTIAYPDIPVSVEKTQSDFRRTVGEKLTSAQEYAVTFPSHESDGTFIEIDPKIHRLRLQSRDNFPVKTFRIIAVGDTPGVVYEAICIKEG